MEYIQINASTRRPRHEVTVEVKEAIAGAGGWVTGFQQFSNISVCLTFEMGAESAATLIARLEAQGLRLSEESRRRGAELAERPEAEVRGTCQLTFFHSEPDERQMIPAVPG